MGRIELDDDELERILAFAESESTAAVIPVDHLSRHRRRQATLLAPTDRHEPPSGLEPSIEPRTVDEVTQAVR